MRCSASTNGRIRRPTSAISSTGLARDKALDLLKRVTGKRRPLAGISFEAQRNKLIAALGQLDKLPAGVRSELLGLLPKLTSKDAGKLRRALALLGSDDTGIQEQALRGLLDQPAFASTPIGRLVVALGERGLLALLDRLPTCAASPQTVLSILDGGVVKRLQKFVTDRLSLGNVLDARTERDFNGLDSFLLGRLSAFFDKTIQFADLEEVRQSIHLVLAKRADVYDKVRKALHSRYALDLTETWQRADARTAVLDVVFDTSKDEGRALLASVVRDAEVDLLMTAPSQAVEIRSAVLTHELTRKTVVDVSLPYFSSHTESFNTSLARVSAEDDGGRVLMYDATGEDVVVVRNRFRSSLSVSIAAVVPAAKSAMPDLRVHSTDGSTWSYTLRHGRDGMRRAELEAVTRPFIAQYMADQFTDGTSLGTWYAELDRTVEGILANGPDEFGDVLATMEVTMPGETLGAWMLPVADVTQASKRVSKAIQAALKRVLPFYYLTDVSRLHALSPSAALLGWASIRPSNDVTVAERSARVRRRPAGLLGPRRCRSPPADGAELNHAAEPAGAPGAAAAAARRGRDAPRRGVLRGRPGVEPALDGRRRRRRAPARPADLRIDDRDQGRRKPSRISRASWRRRRPRHQRQSPGSPSSPPKSPRRSTSSPETACSRACRSAR